MEQFTETNKTPETNKKPSGGFNPDWSNTRNMSIRHSTSFMESIARFADDEIDAASGHSGGLITDFEQERLANISLMLLCDTIDFFCHRRVEEATAELKAEVKELKAEIQSLRHPGEQQKAA